LTPRIHDTAAAGFSAGSGAYARGRPSYPADAIEFLTGELGLGPAKKVLDLAAGTGKFTALLVPTGAEIVAVEPVKQMGDELRAGVEGVEVLEGTAEAIPLPDASIDTVTVAQAFHWFDRGVALVEIARVLRPGGGLALLWNRRDESVPWVRRMSEVLQWHEFGHSDYDQVDWAAVVAETGLFTDVRDHTFTYEHELDRDGLADRVRSISYVAAMDETERERRVKEVIGLVEDKPDRFPLPYNTLVFWCSKRS
jgi:SAM-dependent methyltransferase